MLHFLDIRELLTEARVGDLGRAVERDPRVRSATAEALAAALKEQRDLRDRVDELNDEVQRLRDDRDMHESSAMCAESEAWAFREKLDALRQEAEQLGSCRPAGDDWEVVS